MSSDIVSLRQYVEKVFGQYEAHHTREHQLLAEALEHSRQVMEARLEGMNEFRAQIQDERKDLMSVDRYNVRHELIETKISVMEKTVANMQGRMTAIAAAITVFLVAMELVLRFVV